MIIVNGKHYPLWSQFVEGKEGWIGGRMYSHDGMMGDSAETEITDVLLEPCNEDSACLRFTGKDFDLAGDVKYLGVGGDQRPGWLKISMTYGSGDYFCFKKRAELTP